MFQRVLAFLLLLGYFAGQLATMPHAHVAGDAEHHNQAHLHSSWFYPWSQTSSCCHSHQGDHAHHSHQGDCESHVQIDSPGKEHSHDCIVLPQPVHAAAPSQDISTTEELGPFASLCILVTDLMEHVQPVESHAVAATAVASSSPLYLLLRTLRI